MIVPFAGYLHQDRRLRVTLRSLRLVADRAGAG
jgi:hypothetical protein